MPPYSLDVFPRLGLVDMPADVRPRQNPLQLVKERRACDDLELVLDEGPYKLISQG